MCLAKASSTRSEHARDAAAGLRGDRDHARPLAQAPPAIRGRTSSTLVSPMSHFERTTSVEHFALRASSATAGHGR